MTHVGSKDIAISRLRVLGDKRVAQSLARELTQANWQSQFLSHAQQSLIMVRELRVSGQSQFLQDRCAKQLEYLLSHAVGGAHASQSSSAVIFKSLPELLAFLLCDLAQGDAAGKWYWQRWGVFQYASREDSIAHVLCDNMNHLPAIIDELVVIDKLRLVWGAISSTVDLRLIDQLARHCQIDAYHFIDLHINVNNLEKSIRSMDVNSSFESQIQYSVSRQLEQHKNILHAWLPVISHMAPTDHRLHFAALISGVSLCPLLVIRSPIAVIHGFIYSIKKKASYCGLPLLINHVDENVNLLDCGHRYSFANHASSSDEKSMRDQLQLNSSQKSKISFEASDTCLSARFKTCSQFGLGNINVIETLDTRSLNREQNTLSMQSPLGFKAGDASQSGINALGHNSFLQNADFFTHCGGFFYLINAMRSFITTDFLANQTLATGWLWVFDCGRLLAKKVGVVFELPLLQFFANVSGFESVNDLTSSNPSPESQQLFELIEHRIGTESLWSIENNFLKSSAHVVTTASHIDVFYSLDAVRLDIRLAGLDVNPGWILWLGRVVTFHYLDLPKP